MTTLFVDSNATGGGTGVDWANACTTINAAIALSSSSVSNIFWVSDLHHETKSDADLIVTFKGTAAHSDYVYCVDHTKDSPSFSDLKTTAIVETVAKNLTLAGIFYCYGVTFACGGANLVTALGQKYESCLMWMKDSTAGRRWLFGGEFVNTKYRVEHVGSYIQWVYYGIWRDTEAFMAGSVMPTSLVSGGAFCNFHNVDFSAIGSGKMLLSNVNGGRVVNCRINPAVTLVSPLVGLAETSAIDFIHCDSGATNYRAERYSYTGTQVAETSIVRSGGAGDGVTPISWAVATTAYTCWVMPFISLPIAIWNDTVGSEITVTIHATSNLAGGAFPNNDQVWIEVEYLGNASYPLGSFANNTKVNNLAAGSAYSADGETWSGSATGGRFAMSVTFTPQMKGYLSVVVKCAKPSTIFYIDPKIELS